MASITGVNKYEEIRLKNIQDNKAILAKLMHDVNNLVKTPVKAPPRKRQCVNDQNTSPTTPVRCNPSRSCRPITRNIITRRQSSLLASSPSSTLLASSNSQLVVKFGAFRKFDQNNNKKKKKNKITDSDSDCDSVTVYDEDDDEDDDDDDDEYQLELKDSCERRKYRRSCNFIQRDVNTDPVTEDDLKRVAMYVSEKRYDKEYGTSCHQCRQKTDDMKTICRAPNCVGVRGQFCGPCLRNRYGEDARECLKNTEWTCPPCRGICNCSFCRRHAGKSSTGILIHMARNLGFEDCNSYLQSLRKQ